MFKHMNFSRKTTAITRNGLVICRGIELMSTNGGKDFMISPLTKNGVSNSFIEIPKEEIPNIIQTLKAIARSKK